MEYIENRTFDEINVGDGARLVRTLTEQDITLFAVMSGDINPAHVDPEYAKSSRFREVIGHGMWSGALISTVLGTEFPGPGTIYLGQDLRFRRPVKVGDTVTITVQATEKDASKGKVVLKTECLNQDGEVVVTGIAEVIAPREKVRRAKVDLPEIRFDDREARFRDVMARVKARHLSPVDTAIIAPTDIQCLTSAVEAAREGIIVPVLIGPETRIREAAEVGGLDIAGLRIVPTANNREAVAMAIHLAREGRVEGIMKGCITAEELVVPVVSATRGLRTDRRISHVHVLDVPTYPKPLFITDTMVNIAPTLDAKRDICQNAIDLAHSLGIPAPKVAILAAVETINPKMPATIDAATLCKMAERGQITGGILDGPLTFDHAVSLKAAETTGIRSAVAGQADILVVPDLESGNMIAKQLAYLADAVSAGIVLGAKVPIALTSRTDDRHSWLASAMLVLLVAHVHRRAAVGTMAA
ncbi:MAG TPA: bifunctional enoyl-CoA hydratase/phosphate acetyltransferase [Rhodocyclaceae bacterium]|jgi:phosphate acetyltransferase|nr:bifunctional enoyl-CoA hydratase/phosphate acetyltransferase [Rhodocyclaceae bacterium]